MIFPGFEPRPETATVTTVPSAAVTTVLLAANPARRRFMIYNDSTKDMRVTFGPTTSAASFSFILQNKATWSGVLNDYTGVVSGQWLAVNGDARVTEIS